MSKKNKRKVSRGKTAVSAPKMEAATSSAMAESSPARSTFSRRTAASAPEFNPDYTYVIHDLKRIGTLAGSFLVILIILSFIIK